MGIYIDELEHDYSCMICRLNRSDLLKHGFSKISKGAMWFLVSRHSQCANCFRLDFFLVFRKEFEAEFASSEAC